MIIRTARIGNLEAAWNRLYADNTALTPYSSYAFNRIACRYYRFGPRRILFFTRIFELLDGQGQTVMIIPLYGNQNRYYIIGDLLMTGHLDFIYKADITDDDFAQALRLLAGQLKGASLLLNKISERSLLQRYLSARYPETEKSICVNVHFGTDFDGYVKSLSKNMRRHIRNMYNRLGRESVNWEVQVLMDTPISQQLKGEILQVYNERALEKNGKKVDWLLEKTRHHVNPITLSTAQMEGNFNAILHIDGKLAAFSSGYVYNDHTTVITPRGAINTSYAKFSPGLLLDLETIRWLIDNTGITDLDLSRGNEEYKYALGGTEHYNYSYELLLSPSGIQAPHPQGPEPITIGTGD